MPFALVIIGLMMVITGAKDTHEELGKQLTLDFTGDKNFTVWLAALGTVGAVGYVKDLQPVSRAFMVLIIIAMVVRNGNFFSQFQSALARGPETINRAASPQSAASSTDGSASPQASAGNLDAGIRFLQGKGTMEDWLSLPWLKETPTQVRQNFGTFMNNIVPSVKFLLGIP